MIVYDLNVVRFTLNPGEADTVLIVDANAVLTSSFAFESLKVVAGRYPQLLQGAYRVEMIELPRCHPPQILRAGASSLRRVPAIEHVLGPGILE
jgi:hypothetical protein